MPIEALKDLIDQPQTTNPIIKQMTRYMANVPGTYWHRASQDLSAVISSNGYLTAFLKLTLADFHCPLFHCPS